MSLKMTAGCFLAIFVCLLGNVLCQQLKCVVCNNCATLTCAYANSNLMDCATSCYSQEISGKINRGCYNATAGLCPSTVTVAPAAASSAAATSAAATSAAATSAAATSAAATSAAASSAAASSAAATPAAASPTISAVQSSSSSPKLAILCCSTNLCGKAEALSSVVADATCSASSLLPGIWLLTIAGLLVAASDLLSSGVRSSDVPLL